MRIPVNLASDPFRRDRPMIVASSVVGLVLTVLLAVLIFLAIGERDRFVNAGFIAQPNPDWLHFMTCRIVGMGAACPVAE